MPVARPSGSTLMPYSSFMNNWPVEMPQWREGGMDGQTEGGKESLQEAPASIGGNEVQPTFPTTLTLYPLLLAPLISHLGALSRPVLDDTTW